MGFLKKPTEKSQAAAVFLVPRLIRSIPAFTARHLLREKSRILLRSLHSFSASTSLPLSFNVTKRIQRPRPSLGLTEKRRAEKNAQRSSRARSRGKAISVESDGEESADSDASTSSDDESAEGGMSGKRHRATV